jgi:hypothetical protein
MTGPRRIALAAAALLALGPATTMAQEKTAEGAQKFMRLLASDGVLTLNLVDASGGALRLEGAKTSTYRWLKNGVETADGPYPVHVTKDARALSHLLSIEVDNLNRSGQADLCVTRVHQVRLSPSEPKLGRTFTSDDVVKEETFFGFDRKPYRSTQVDAYEDPLVKFAAPHYIDWGKATITRTPQGRILAASSGPKFRTELTYAGQDPEMADRIEYAMKFLKASCDRTAGTGF